MIQQTVQFHFENKFRMLLFGPVPAYLSLPWQAGGNVGCIQIGGRGHGKEYRRLECRGNQEAQIPKGLPGYQKCHLCSVFTEGEYYGWVKKSELS